MSLIRINRQPSRRQLNGFGLAWLAFFAMVGWIVFRRTGSAPAAVGVWTAAAAVAAAGWMRPAWMRIIYLAAVYVSLPIGLVVSCVVLAATYYLVLTPTALLLRLAGVDPLHRRFDPELPTYWAGRKTDRDAKSYFRQF